MLEIVGVVVCTGRVVKMRIEKSREIRTFSIENRLVVDSVI